jgi:hypothetical protein
VRPLRKGGLIAGNDDFIFCMIATLLPSKRFMSERCVDVLHCGTKERRTRFMEECRKWKKMHRSIHELHIRYQNGKGSLLRFVSLFISSFLG